MAESLSRGELINTLKAIDKKRAELTVGGVSPDSPEMAQIMSDGQFINSRISRLDEGAEFSKASKSTLGLMGDYTLEFMAAANRGAVALPDLPGTLLDAVLNLAGTDIRTPKLRNAPGIRQGVAGNFAPDGPLKDATKFAGEVVGGSVVPMAATAKLADRLGKATSGIASTAPRFIGKGAAAPVLAGKIPTVTAGAVKAPSLGVIQSAAASPSAFLTKEATATALFAAGGGTGAALTENDPLASMSFVSILLIKFLLLYLQDVDQKEYQKKISSYSMVSH
jgi:hypothetical protein